MQGRCKGGAREVQGSCKGGAEEVDSHLRRPGGHRRREPLRVPHHLQIAAAGQLRRHAQRARARGARGAVREEHGARQHAPRRVEQQLGGRRAAAVVPPVDDEREQGAAMRGVDLDVGGEAAARVGEALLEQAAPADAQVRRLVRGRAERDVEEEPAPRRQKGRELCATPDSHAARPPRQCGLVRGREGLELRTLAVGHKHHLRTVRALHDEARRQRRH